MAVELDYMENYTTDELARQAYASSDLKSVLISHTAEDTRWVLGDYDNVEYRMGQSFPLSATATIQGVSIYFGTSSGSPTGNVVFRIETDVDGKPSGTLAHASATKTLSSITDDAWNDAMFATAFDLPAGTYWIKLNCDNQAYRVYWHVRRNSAGGYADGVGLNSADGVWQADAGNDLAFKVYTYNLQCFSESITVKEGTYSLKGMAKAADSLNDTLTRTVDPTIDLSNQNAIEFWIRSSRTGQNIKIGIHDAGGVTTEITPNILAANTWQKVVWNISGVANADKDAIDSIIITIVNAD